MKNVTSSSSSETAAAAAVLGSFLLGSALFPSHRTRHGTAESRRQRQKRLSITAPPPSSPLSRVCAMKSVGDRTGTRRARAKTGWPYRQRADRGRSVALFERPDPQLKIVGDSGHGSLRGPSSLFVAFCALPCPVVRGSPARIADDDITSLRARRSWVSTQVPCCFLFMTDIDFSTSDEINITSDGECCMHVSSFRRRVRGAAGPVSSSAFASARALRIVEKN